MIGREMGSMLHANEVIRIIETNPEMTAEERADFFALVLTSEFAPSLSPSHVPIVTEWWALINDVPVAYANLQDIDSEGGVRYGVIVSPDRRGIGIGKFMTRFATDQAIRFRRRSIFCEVGPQCPLIRTLEEEEFDATEMEPLIQFRKILKWREAPSGRESITDEW